MRLLKFYINVWVITILLLQYLPAFAQPQDINFHKLGFSEGLHDGIIRCIAEDKLGYVWIGSVGAVNRFDGRKATQFTNIPGDTTSPYGAQPRAMHSDKAGLFWVGFETGLTEFDFLSRRFRRVKIFKDQFITGIESVNDTTLFVLTRKGFYRYHPHKETVLNYTKSNLPQLRLFKNTFIHSMCVYKQKLFAGTDSGWWYWMF